MSEVYIAKFNTDETIPEKELLEALPVTLKERIERTKNSGARLERLAAYSLLVFVLKKYGYDASNYVFEFPQKVKPYIKNLDVDFSVSHTDGVCAVAVSQSEDIGVDVELVGSFCASDARQNITVRTDKGRAENIEKFISRYFDGFEPSGIKNPPTVFSYHFGEGGFETEEIEALPFTEETVPFAVWTELESVLKCDGGGFAAAPSVNGLLHSIVTESVLITIGGGAYSLSVSRKNKR